MVKYFKNHNTREGSKAPMLDNELNVATIVEEEQHEDDQIDQHFVFTEKQLFEQRMLKMELFVRAVVHENTNLRA